MPRRAAPVKSVAAPQLEDEEMAAAAAEPAQPKKKEKVKAKAKRAAASSPEEDEAEAAAAKPAAAKPPKEKSSKPPSKKQKQAAAAAEAALAASASSLTHLPHAFFQPLLRILLQDLQASVGIPFMPTPLCDLISEYSAHAAPEQVHAAFVACHSSHDDGELWQRAELIQGEEKVRAELVTRMRCTEREQYHSDDQPTRGTDGLALLFAQLDTAESKHLAHRLKELKELRGVWMTRPEGGGYRALEALYLHGAERMSALLQADPQMKLPALGETYRQDFLNAMAQLNMARFGPVEVAVAQFAHRDQASSAHANEEDYEYRSSHARAAVLARVDPVTGELSTEIQSSDGRFSFYQPPPHFAAAQTEANRLAAEAAQRAPSVDPIEALERAIAAVGGVDVDKPKIPKAARKQLAKPAKRVSKAVEEEEEEPCAEE